MPDLNLLDFMNIPVVLALGIITSVQDMKSGKIKNKWIIIGIAYSLLSLGIMILTLGLNNIPVNIEYLRIYCLNILISLVVGFIFWLSKLWSPGDGKLFLMYASLIPLSAYKWGDIGLFPSYIILINTFTPVLFYFLVKLFSRINPGIVIQEFKKILDPKLLLSFALFLFGFGFLSRIILSYLAIQNSQVINIILILGMMILFQNVLKINLNITGIALSAVRVIFDFSAVFSYAFLATFLVQYVFFVLLIYFILNLGFHAFSKPIYIEDLKPGMSLAEDIVDEKGEYIKIRPISVSFISSFFNFMQARSIFSDYSSLSESDILRIKKLHSEGKFKDHVIFIYEKIHFAVFMLIGIIITLIFRGNFLMALKIFVDNFK